jgi:N utilization substance protein A
MRGVRIQSIVSELSGEKIDVIEWNPDPALYIQKALSPARVLTVHPEDDKEGKMALVVVPDDQLSLAIGREGQNARLAAKLTNWRIDIQGSTEAARDALAQVDADPEIKEKLAGTMALVQTALQRHAEQQLPWNTDELQQIKLLIDGHHYFTTARKRAEREKAKAVTAPTEPLPETVETLPSETARQEAINTYRARIPAQSYATPIGEIGLNPRVLEHIERAGLTSVGQIHERLAIGDEAMLSIEGIGPKGLAHIKQTIDEKGLGLKPLITEQAPAIAAQPIAPAPPVEPIVAAPPEEKPAEAVATEQPLTEAAEEQPAAQPAAQPAVAETAVAEVAAEPAVVAPVGPIDIEEIEDEEELERKGGKKKGKRKDRTLIFDEERGMVIAKKQRKAGRDKDVFDFEE